MTITATWRLLDDVDRSYSAAEQMAADSALLEGVAAGAPAALRLYRWAEPALSLGRFQPAADVDHRACERLGVDVVRRPTGGRALLHGSDLTYAVAMPRPDGVAGTVDAVYCSLASALVAGLARLGVEASIARHDDPRPDGPVCFAGAQGADLRVGARKLCGSAQARRGAAVLQHGSILLDRLAFDETHLVRGPDGRPGVSSDALRGMTATLRELRAPADPRVVAHALSAGFRETLDVDFT